MKPEVRSQTLLGITRSKAKMYEFAVPDQYHIDIPQDPAKLFSLSVGLLGDVAARSNDTDIQRDSIQELSSDLAFSAHFFDAYLQSRLDDAIDTHVTILAAASYYLCDLPGSSMVLASRLQEGEPDNRPEDLDRLLLWLLQGNYSTSLDKTEGTFGSLVDSASQEIAEYFARGTGTDLLIETCERIRKAAYDAGTSRHLLLADVISAVVGKKIENSTWHSVPLYSGLPASTWEEVLQKETFTKELWPAQHLLGMAGVFEGRSAVVQMPTSAGKTKATEIVIRSTFLAKRATLAVIVAPYRALCHEIKNSLASAFFGETVGIDVLSDAFQTDFDIAELLGQEQVLVMTPEKLLYVLRHIPDLASKVGLAIFDEAHQFDSGARGITYELLLTSLRSTLPTETQKLLISAVISNAESVGQWLNNDPLVVAGSRLSPTLRSVGFASWQDERGRIEYVNKDNPDTPEFFVPRVVQSEPLSRKKGEKKDRVFPDKSAKGPVGKEVALFLGLKLAPKGSVAVFCGRKDTASGLLSLAVDVFSRDLQMEAPCTASDSEEVSRLAYLIGSNLGKEAPATKSAELGIYSHHGNTPHGIRLAVEHGMREGQIHFVVCTSTLAQGVNLPIRYLIVTTIYQGAERIKVRDFHNLIGRAGRAGMHTEGSVLFADPQVFDQRKSQSQGWRWSHVRELLDPNNSEPCDSNLLSIFDPLKSADGKYSIKMNSLSLVRAYISDPDDILHIARAIVERHADKRFTKEDLERQIIWRVNLISAIESFLVSYWNEEGTLTKGEVSSLAKGTLAYSLVDKPTKKKIRKLFRLLAKNVSNSVTSDAQRQAYSRTLYGIRDSKAVEEWTSANIALLLSAEDAGSLLRAVWPMLSSRVQNRVFKKLDDPDVLPLVARDWLQGKPFHEILATIEKHGARLIWGTQRRDVKIDHVVDLCEHGLSYDGMLLISAITEFASMHDLESSEGLVERLQQFQKQIKYGLPCRSAIAIYELGFSDRVIAIDIASELGLRDESKSQVVASLKENRDTAFAVVQRYPSYYHVRLRDLTLPAGQ